MTLHPFLAELAAEGLYTPPSYPAAVTHGHGNGQPPPAGDPGAERWAAAALAAESDELARTAPGTRNARLNHAAFRMGQVVALGYVSELAVADALLIAAQVCGLPPGEAEATLRSGLRAGQAHPRQHVELRGGPEVSAAYTVDDQKLIKVSTDASTDATDGLAVSAGRTTDVSTDATDARRRLIPGGDFIHLAPAEVPALWGRGDEVLWAEGEPLLITGPTGVGKTTLGGMVIAGRLGLIPDVLGYPVRPGAGRTLVLAMDRPAQIQRALARLLRAWPAELLNEKLVVWKGPPPADLARQPHLLQWLAEQAGADTVVLDSLKDAAVKLSDEETGQGLSRAMNLCVATGVEVLGYHHQTKRGAGGLGKPTSLADVYGSGWITAGAGSVVLLWGAAGDPVVELSHLKQPASEVGPLRVLHDHDAGHSAVFQGVDLLSLLASGPQTASAVASMVYGDGASDASVAKARRKLDRLVRDGLATRLDEPTRGGTHAGQSGGSQGARYALVPLPPVTNFSTDASADSTDARPTRPPAGFGEGQVRGDFSTDARPTVFPVSAGQTTDAKSFMFSTDATDARPTRYPVTAGQTTDGSTDATDAPRPTLAPPSIGGRVVGAQQSLNSLECDRCHTVAERLIGPAGGRQVCPACAYPNPADRPGHHEEEDE